MKFLATATQLAFCGPQIATRRSSPCTPLVPRPAFVGSSATRLFAESWDEPTFALGNAEINENVQRLVAEIERQLEEVTLETGVTPPPPLPRYTPTNKVESWFSSTETLAAEEPVENVVAEAHMEDKTETLVAEAPSEGKMDVIVHQEPTEVKTETIIANVPKEDPTMEEVVVQAVKTEDVDIVVAEAPVVEAKTEVVVAVEPHSVETAGDVAGTSALSAKAELTDHVEAAVAAPVEEIASVAEKVASAAEAVESAAAVVQQVLEHTFLL